MNIVSKVRDALFIQALLSLAALPFVLWWRLPYPALSFVGNLLFPLFLSLILLLSSLVFFAHLFHLPAGMLCFCLNATTQVWDVALRTNPPPCWVPCASVWTIAAYVLLTAALLLLVSYAPKKSNYMSALLCALGIACSAVYIADTTQQPLTILSKNKNSLVFVPGKHNDLEIHDHGYLNTTHNNSSLVDYEIMPHLLFTYAHPSYVRVYGKGKRAYEAQQRIRAWLT